MFKKSTFTGATAMVTCVLAAPSLAQTHTQGAQTGMDMPMHSGMDMSTSATAPVNAATYLQMAASGDQFEIQSSQLALQKTQEPALRSFAQMLIDDHTSLSSTLANAARTAGLTAPAPVLSAKHSQMLDALRAAGADFDTTYRQQQVLAHAEAAGLHRSYATSGDVAVLRTAAAATLPIVERHLQQAQSMSSSTATTPQGGTTNLPQPYATPPSTPSTGTANQPEPSKQQRAGERG